MINKVKQAAPLKLVHSSKQAKNGLGGQSGEAYSHSPPQKEQPQSQKNDASPVPKHELEPTENQVTQEGLIDEQVGLTIVVKEWLEEGKGAQTSTSKARASLKYQGESAPAKGMLLNKKIS